MKFSVCILLHEDKSPIDFGADWSIRLSGTRALSGAQRKILPDRNETFRVSSLI